MTSRPLVPEPETRAGSQHYRMRLVTDLRDIGRDAWDALLAQQPEATPFLRYDFLHALHESGSASPDTGWSPRRSRSRNKSVTRRSPAWATNTN